MGRSRGPADDDPTHRSKRRRVASSGEHPESGTPGTNEGKGPLYHCNNCNKDISGILRIKCAKCPDFDLCVECFTTGAEVTPHKNNHPYKVMEYLSFPLIHPEWNAEEESLLLEAIEMYGLGNWSDVADHVGSKSQVECLNHYREEYHDSPCYPLPDMSHVIGKTKAELLTMAKAHVEGKKGFSAYGNAISKPPKEEPTISPLRIKLEDFNKDALAEGRTPSNFMAGENTESKTNGLAGHSALNNSASASKMASNALKFKEVPDGVGAGGKAMAEDSLKNRSIGGKKPEPSGKDGSLLLKCSGYNPKRQEFDPEYDNDAELPLAEMEFRENDSEAEREMKVRMLHIYLSRIEERKQRKKFILEREPVYSRRLEELPTKEEKELYQRLRVFMRFQSQEEHDALFDKLNSTRKAKERLEELKEYQAAGFHKLAEAELYASEKRKREAEANSKKPKESGSLFASTKLAQRANRTVNRERGEGDSSPGYMVENQRTKNTGGQAAVGTSICSVSSSQKGAKAPLACWDISGLPGADLLSTTEHQICIQNRFFPAYYLKMKQELMFMDINGHAVKRSDIYGLFDADPNKVDKVYDFLLRMGWIHGDESTTV